MSYKLNDTLAQAREWGLSLCQNFNEIGTCIKDIIKKQ